MAKKHARVMVDPKKQHNLIGVWQTPRIGLGSVALAYRLLLYSTCFPPLTAGGVSFLEASIRDSCSDYSVDIRRIQQGLKKNIGRYPCASVWCQSIHRV